MTRVQAKRLHDSGFWRGLSDSDIVKFQLFEDRLCIPFDVFHEAVEKVLGRPVFTHEFAFMDLLQKEFLKERPAPSLAEIMDLIPAEKRVLVVAP